MLQEILNLVNSFLGLLSSIHWFLEELQTTCAGPTICFVLPALAQLAQVFFLDPGPIVFVSKAGNHNQIILVIIGEQCVIIYRGLLKSYLENQKSLAYHSARVVKQVVPFRRTQANPAHMPMLNSDNLFKVAVACRQT